jgi:hypothetical protein
MSAVMITGVRAQGSYAAGYPDIRTACAHSAGRQNFPTLQAYLPQINGGSLPARAAPRALAELQRFANQTRDFARIVQALEEVLHAAIETGNPVIWT